MRIAEEGAVMSPAAPRKRPTGYWLLAGAVLFGLYYFNQGTTQDLSQPPVKEVSYPALPSDALPKPMITAPIEPFEHGWAEVSPMQAVAAEKDRKARLLIMKLGEQRGELSNVRN